MGQVAVKFKIMPTSTNTDINSIKSKIEKITDVKDAKIENLAFGLRVLKILIMLPDRHGISEIENKIKQISGVSEVETESITLV
ncbi:MAG: elongation factor 1-beta [Candidatus Aenigmatarchaeota archaeon]